MHRYALREGQKTKPSKENKSMQETNRAALFPLGQIVATPGGSSPPPELIIVSSAREPLFALITNL
jgi:hypothetical protein